MNTHRLNDMRVLAHRDSASPLSPAIIALCKHSESLEEEIKILRTFINKIAGPYGCGCDIGSQKHMAQTYRELADRIKEEREKT